MARKLGRTFPEAFVFLLKRCAIYRQSWPRCKRIYLRPNVLIPAVDVCDYDGTVTYWTPLQEDLFATDWRILDDQS